MPGGLQKCLKMRQPREVHEGYLNANARASGMSQFSPCCILGHDPGGEFRILLNYQKIKVPVGWVRSLKKLAFTHEANLQPLIDQGKKA